MADAEEPKQVVAYVDLNGLTGQMHREVKRLILLASYGFQAAEGDNAPHVSLPGALIVFDPAPSVNWDAETASDEFENWMLSHAIIDLIEKVKPFLLGVRAICELWGNAHRGPFTVDQFRAWEEREMKALQKFDRFDLPKKLEHLTKGYPPLALAPLTAKIQTINRARNCVVHKFGIVAPDDCGSGDTLVVEWQKYGVFRVSPGKEEEINEFPAEINGDRGEQAQVRMTAARKEFKVGDRISFTAREFTEICLTVDRWGLQMSKCLEDYGRAKGVTFREAIKQPPAKP